MRVCHARNHRFIDSIFFNCRTLRKTSDFKVKRLNVSYRRNGYGTSCIVKHALNDYHYQLVCATDG
ncbi:hypothetical protein C2C93_23045 [Escherichia coli]|uniref:Uncharacterized protein n=1 Tax=Escherichia coli O6:K15:H31 (strain 536 / UPEC) TaxID=362663 RepID=A0A454A1D1_ECOL5|nr:hypothetical protein ECP_0280 [Escherichia coli 536]ATB79709.1 hypothetical protein CNQ55_20575 [Escherichia coli]EFJ63258.1 hypothetical protein HMPREF9553_00622 [Escherichia coli MS 200-1]EFN6731380.1 hypothetical protein [Escherichia coli O6:H31]EFN6857105.1 hypothetical protein [Escherichia coli O6]EGB81066.1 hypothetical protein HMPREF9533_04139 [Escherichia coli MS 60-1]ESE32746.1 hypothetical protein HMPREF1622_03289 [Escherichia coli A35218R]